MRILFSSAIAAALAALMIAPAEAARVNRPPTMSELLSILRVHTYRIRTPTNGQWNIEVLKLAKLRAASAKPKSLSARAYLFAMREQESGVYDFTLPDSDGGVGQGKFELCKEVNCEGQYGLKWLDAPRYSADGSQCILAEYYYFDEQKPSAYLALVRIKPPVIPSGSTVVPLRGPPIGNSTPAAKGDPAKRNNQESIRPKGKGN